MLFNNMKLLLVYLIIILAHNANCQVKSVLVDSNSKVPIPYASIYVKSQMRGTSTELNGSFRIKINSSDSLVISS